LTCSKCYRLYASMGGGPTEPDHAAPIRLGNPGVGEDLENALGQCWNTGPTYALTVAQPLPTAQPQDGYR
jgi:hypothetical protein